MSLPADEYDDLLRRLEAARTAAQDAQQHSRALAADALQAEQTVRRRISEMLHDDAIQTLLAASQDLKEAVRGDSDSLVRAGEAVEQTIRQLREAVFQLHPIALEHGGLESALNAVARHQGRRGGFSARVRVSPDTRGQHELLILAVARELLTNVAKHAGAREVLVNLARTDSNVILQVSDDGCGMRPEDRRVAFDAGHIGLASSGERVTVVGGQLDVLSWPGEGTVVRAVLPVEDPRSATAVTVDAIQGEGSLM